jgi:hypothetical protein
VIQFLFKQLNTIGLYDRASAISFNLIMALPAGFLFLFSIIPYFPKSLKIKNIMIYFSLIFQLLWMSYHLNKSTDWSSIFQILSGSMQEVDYLKKRHLEYQLIEEINNTLPKSACVYPIYTSNSLYWYDVCVKFAGYNSGQKLITFIKQSENAEQLRNLFSKEYITHLFVNLNRMKNVIKNNLSNEQLIIWNDFVQKFLQVKISKTEFLRRGYILYEIKDK